jgi:hypothetical protein
MVISSTMTLMEALIQSPSIGKAFNIDEGAH